MIKKLLNYVFYIDYKNTKDIKIKLFGLFPFLKLKTRTQCKTILFLNFVPIWKIKTCNSKKIHYLFAFLPVFASKSDIDEKFLQNKQKYDKRIERLYELMKTRSNFFIYPTNRAENIDYEVLTDICAKIKNM